MKETLTRCDSCHKEIERGEPVWTLTMGEIYKIASYDICVDCCINKLNLRGFSKDINIDFLPDETKQE